jgi:hypothetical protein
MPTEANKKVIDRELSVVSAVELTNLGSPLLQEVINYASHVLLRCTSSKHLSASEDVDVAPMVLFRLILELADGVQVLCENSIGNPAVPIARSMFEGLLSLEYILENKSEYESRSIAWIVGYGRARLYTHKQFDDDTTEGRKFKASWLADLSTKNVPLPDKAEVKKAIANMEAFLQKPHVKKIEKMFSDYKAKHRGNPNWFSINGGPRTIEQLSDHLHRGGLYNLLYREWSSIAHGTDFLSFVAPRDSKGRSGFKGLRDAKDIKEIYVHSITFLFTAIKRMLVKFRPGEEASFEKWYKKEIKSNFAKLSGLEVSIDYIMD